MIGFRRRNLRRLFRQLFASSSQEELASFLFIKDFDEEEVRALQDSEPNQNLYVLWNWIS